MIRAGVRADSLHSAGVRERLERIVGGPLDGVEGVDGLARAFSHAGRTLVRMPYGWKALVDNDGGRREGTLIPWWIAPPSA